MLLDSRTAVYYLTFSKPVVFPCLRYAMLKVELNHNIHLVDLIKCFTDALDLISPMLGDHHKRTAYIASCIAREMGMSDEDQTNILLAGALHDIGASSVDDRLITFDFDMKSMNQHALVGSRMIREFIPLSFLSPLIKHHHAEWANGAGDHICGEAVPVGSHIIHLADRVDILINYKRHVLTQVGSIRELIEKHAGTIFMPEAVRAFASLSRLEYFWMDIASPALWNVIMDQRLSYNLKKIEFDADRLSAFAEFFSRLIDFRSSFTATHSSAVAAIVEFISQKTGFSDFESFSMKIAGYLHDLGKLAIHQDILEKPGPLTAEEYSIMKSHVYYTNQILKNISSFETINQWASHHHEYLDGSGYPFHYTGGNLSLGSRIMTVTDIFTALTENRPYRSGLELDDVINILEPMEKEMKLDAGIIELIKHNINDIDWLRRVTQKASRERYDALRNEIEN
jgi:HD-GYP domain-containing protein (c-di-GMP phosphodiesterase class II)